MNKVAEDRFKIYYTEKLWEMIPAIYRHEDGLESNSNPGVLRRLVEVIASQSAILRRSHDSLWDDQFIELCNDWAVPYIADLLGTRLISAQNKRGRRVDVAKTIYYRRRKGTLRILEELISDISGWDGKVVENFRRLTRTRHGLDPKPGPLAGRFTGTPPGGWADLRQQASSELANGPFDEYSHTADVRKHRGEKGRYAIPKLAFHLYRLGAFKVLQVTPFSLGDGAGFTFDPSGRDIPLFVRRDRQDNGTQKYDWDTWHSAKEWELPGPIRCRLLGHEEYLIEEVLIEALVAAPGLTNAEEAALLKFANYRFRNEGRLRISLESEGITAANILLPLLHDALISDCGKRKLLSENLSDEASLFVQNITTGNLFPTEEIQSGQLANWTASAQAETRLVIDPQRGRFLLLEDAVGSNVTTMYHYGFPGYLGAGTYDRREVEDCEVTATPITGGGDIAAGAISNDGVTQIDDSQTYTSIGNKVSIQNLTLQAANRQRPYIRLSAADNRWRLRTDGHENSKLVLEGLWIGGQGAQVIDLQGNFECVVISHCTLDPGGDTNALGDTISPVPLVIRGYVENLYILSSIMGPIYTDGDGLVENMIVEDSIIQSVEADPALRFNNGETTLNRVTVFGSIDVHRLQASEALITGHSSVRDTQNGCFRFSAAPASSRLPKAYESYLFEKDTKHWFTSRKFGQPAYGQLSETAPNALHRGAENGAEIGAYNKLINAIKQDSLEAKIEEFMPFGLIPIFINET